MDQTRAGSVYVPPAKTRIGSDVLVRILGFLTLFEQTRLRVCSHHMGRIIDQSIMLVNPTHVTDVVQMLMKNCNIVDAGLILIKFIARPTPTPIILINQFILLLHGDLFAMQQYVDVCALMFNILKEKAINEFIANSDISADAAEFCRLSQNNESACRGDTDGFRDYMSSLVFNIDDSTSATRGQDSTTISKPGFIGSQINSELWKKFLNIVMSYDRRKMSKSIMCASPFDLPTSSSSTSEIAEVPSTAAPVYDVLFAELPNVRKYGDATIMFAYFLYKNNQFEAALKMLDRAEKYNNKNPALFWLRGLMYHYYIKNFNLACASYIHAIELDNDFAYPYFSLGVLMKESENASQANFLFRRCLLIDQNHYMALYYQITPLLDDDPNKITTLRAIINMHPTGMAPYLNIASIMHERGYHALAGRKTYWVDAILILKRAIKINPTYALLYRDLGSIYIESGEYDKGTNCLLMCKQLTDDVALKEQIRDEIDRIRFTT
jgi:tetratricopeptide (TPR) repeat protein